MANYEPLTDIQWQHLESLFPKLEKRSRGKPHAPWRSVVNSIFFILFTGEKWGTLPKDPAYATKSAAHRWFVIWDKNGFLEQLLNTYKSAAHKEGAIKIPKRRNRLPAPKKQHELPSEEVI